MVLIDDVPIFCGDYALMMEFYKYSEEFFIGSSVLVSDKSP